MQKTLLITGFVSLIGVGLTSGNEDEYCIPIQIEEYQVKTINKEIHTNRLIEALIQVESSGKEDCVGDKHLIIPSIGVLQIRPIMVREVNRILKRQGKDKRYKNKDRYSRVKSIEMFIIWRDFHHKDHDNEIIARCWNGGPKGWKRKATLHYWNKVQKALKKIE
tara:strand:+ start:27 stop:518 length:492 start_codon:yes stop_codon:yes gene_type:complete